MRKPRIITKSDLRRIEIRNRVFGDEAEKRIWQGAGESRGYCCMPRVLPILLQLAGLKALFHNKNAAQVYVELLSRDWGQGIVEVQDEEAHAFRAGYDGPRGLRSWRERIHALEQAGFIEIRPRANRTIGYVLLVHPTRIMSLLREKKLVGEEHWKEYEEVCREFGIDAPADPLAVGPRRIKPEDQKIRRPTKPATT